MHRDMGLYDERLSDLSESRQKRSSSSVRSPSSAHQSLLFERRSWTPATAKEWAESHGYRYGKVDVTDQYIRIRQFDPKGSKVKRTIPFGRGIRAVVGKPEEKMATKVAAPRRRRRSKKKASAKRPSRRRHSKKTTSAKPRRRRRAKKVEARRRRRRVRAVRETQVVATPRRRRRRRKVRASTVKAWRGNPAGHRKAARKGWKRRKKTKSAHRRRRRHMGEPAMVAAPRRRKRRSHRRRARESVVAAPRRRRHRRMRASRGGGRGMAMAEFGLAMVSGGLGFVLADGLDRFLATYDPTAATKPTDKFTSDGAGTLANTLNVASKPSIMRIAAGVGMTGLPVVGAMYVKNAYARSALEGMAVGSGVSLFKTLWNNILMPLLTPKDTSPGSLQKSYIARLYPAEVAAHINLSSSPPQQAVSSGGSGALSGPPQLYTGVGGPADVGPFALAGDSPYPSAQQALRGETTGAIHGDSPYADTAQALRHQAGLHGDSPYPNAAEALRHNAGMGAPGGHAIPGYPGVGADWSPGPPPGSGPGPQPAGECGCIGEGDQFLGFIGEEQSESDTIFAGFSH